MSQVATQMRWAVSYTYGFMYQLILCMIHFSSIIFHYFLNLFTNENLVTMSFTLPKDFVKIQMDFKGLGWSCVVVLHAYRTMPVKLGCHSSNYSWNYYQMLVWPWYLVKMLPKWFVIDPHVLQHNAQCLYQIFFLYQIHSRDFKAR